MRVENNSTLFFWLENSYCKPYERNIYIMKIEYDYSKGTKNHYSKVLKRQITINLSEEVLDY